jgi:hypothetical protein
VLVGATLDLALRVAALDRRDHPAGSAIAAR